jgi:hypothetical protein
LKEGAFFAVYVKGIDTFTGEAHNASVTVSLLPKGHKGFINMSYSGTYIILYSLIIAAIVMFSIYMTRQNKIDVKINKERQERLF